MSQRATPTLPPNSLHTDRILSTRELMSLTTLSRSTIWRLSRQGDLPSPLQMTPARIGWRESDVIAWLESRDRRGPQEGR